MSEIKLKREKVQTGACPHGKPTFNIKISAPSGGWWWAWDVDEKTPCNICKAANEAVRKAVREDVAWWKRQAGRD